MPGQIVPFEGFCGQTYNLKNFNYSCQRLINRYCEYNETVQAKGTESNQLAPTPGLTTLVSTGMGQSRDGYVTSTNVMYWTFGQNVYEIQGVSGSSLGWTATLIGQVDGYGVVQYADNGTTLFMVTSTGNVWGLDLPSNTISLMTGGGWELATSCTYIDGYVVFTQMGSNQFFWTDLYSTTVEGLNFAAAETNADHAVAVLSNNEDLWVFGQNVTELWYDLGQGTTVFARRTGILVETGAASPYTIQKINNTVMWLSTDQRGGPIVMMSNNYTPTRVSTFAIEEMMNSASSDQIASATATSHQWKGHYFYTLNIAGLPSSLVFDMTATQQAGVPVWHERQSGFGSQATRSIATGHVYFLGKHLCGDANGLGNLYFYDNDANTENGALIARVRVTPHMNNGMKRIKYSSLQINYTPGNILDETVNPQVILQYSDDAGKTWSDEHWISMGQAGEYTNRVIFYQLGVSRNRVFRITDVNNCYAGIHNAELRIELAAT